MNWVLLFLAGLFEVSLAFCLGKTKTTIGTEFYLWGTGFLLSTVQIGRASCRERV